MKYITNVRNFIINGFAMVFMIMLVYFISEGFRLDDWTYFKFLVQLIILVSSLQVAFYCLNKLDIPSLFMQVLIQYMVTVALVFSQGYLFSWYSKSTYWIVYINITIVFVSTYILGILKLNGEIREINRLVRRRQLKD